MPRPRGVHSTPAETSDEELLAVFQAGDRRALGEIFDRYRWFVRSKARCYFLVGAEFDDVEQEGLIGLFKAVRDYDPSHQVSFRCFAELCVTRQILSAIRTATRAKHQPLNVYVSLSSPSSVTDDDSVEGWLEALLRDRCVPDPATELVSRDDLLRVKTSIAEVLSDLEVEVLTLYLEGLTYTEIGARLNRPVKVVDNALQRVKRKLERRLLSTEATDAQLGEAGLGEPPLLAAV